MPCLGSIRVDPVAEDWCQGEVALRVCMRDINGNPWQGDAADISSKGWGIRTSVGAITSYFDRWDSYAQGCFVFRWRAPDNARSGDSFSLRISPSARECRAAETLVSLPVCVADFSCPVPAPVIEHPENGGDLCISWDDLAIPADCQFGFPRPTVRHNGLPVTMTYASRRDESCAIRITANRIGRLKRGDELLVGYNVRCGEQRFSRCAARVKMVASGQRACLDCSAVDGTIVNRQLTAQDTLEVQTRTTTGQAHFVDFVDPNGTATSVAYVETRASGVNIWRYSFAGNCVSGIHRVRVRDAGQPPIENCPVCAIGEFALDCQTSPPPPTTPPTTPPPTLPAEPSQQPVIDQCENGEIALVRGRATALSVSNIHEVVSIKWSSPDPQLRFDPVDQANTTVVASGSGTFTIEVECCFRS